MSKQQRPGPQHGGGGVKSPGQRAPSGGRPHQGQGGQTQGGTALFDPEASTTELVDRLAEQQAERLAINSAQLRRFFGEIKDLYRRYNALAASAADAPEQERIYHEQIEPMFKMIRSKVSYATRVGGQRKLPDEFAGFLSDAIAKVETADHFQRFVLHLEAVVGFMYGEGKVKQ